MDEATGEREREKVRVMKEMMDMEEEKTEVEK